MSNPSEHFSILNRGNAHYKKQVVQEKTQRKFWPGLNAPEGAEENYDDDGDEDDDEDNEEDDVFPDAKVQKAKRKNGKNREIVRAVIGEEEQAAVEDQQQVALQKKLIGLIDGQVVRKLREENKLKRDLDERTKALITKVQRQRAEREEELYKGLRQREFLERYKLEEGMIEDLNENNGEEQIEEESADVEQYQSEENEPQIKLMRPIFVGKDEREVKDEVVDETLRIKQEQERIKQLKAQEAEELMKLAVQRENERRERNENQSSDDEMPDDRDPGEGAAEEGEADATQRAIEYERWKIRELKRIKRDRQERGRYDKERDEIERRRNLTDEERLKENLLLGSDATNRPEKAKYVFLQKYYHKGVFYQNDEDEVLQRDFNLAVAEDLFDKNNPNMPNILKKRRGLFGKKGQSKYTHLTDQDTTDYNPEYKRDEEIMQKMLNKQAGTKGQNILDRKQLQKRQK